MVRLHPYQYAYFNRLAGGVRGANGQYMLDYWGLAFKQAAEHCAQSLRTRCSPSRRAAENGSSRSAGRSRRPEWRSGANSKRPTIRKRADFEMKLGTFYCRDLKAPVLADVTREGVIFARVYDFRGVNVKELLTEPPP